MHLRFEVDTLTLEVEDHGRGVAARDDRRASGLGLVAMRERADLLGGTLGDPSTGWWRNSGAAEGAGQGSRGDMTETTSVLLVDGSSLSRRLKPRRTSA